MTGDYRYDVAFSFLAQDEPIAAELNDLLEGRLSTFFYSKKQEAIAGTDGEKTFGDVFGKDARLVVVLYRTSWGQTPWTRVEETAIRNRAYDYGYDFVIFVPLDEPASVPKWLPKTRLWVGLKRWGPTGAASVIEARVQELGGEPAQESVRDKAVRAERSLQFAERRRALLESDKGVKAANEEFDRLKGEVGSAIADISDTTRFFNFSLKVARQEFAILGRGLALLVSWRNRFINSLEESVLEATLWEGHPPWPGVIHIENPKKLAIRRFHFDILPPGEYRWILNDREQRQFTSADLAYFLVGYCIEQAEKQSRR